MTAVLSFFEAHWIGLLAAYAILMVVAGVLLFSAAVTEG
jgi:hypothetical protein